MKTNTMTLPKPILPEYSVTLPFCKTKVKFRPFIVKEEKLLLMALESAEIEQIVTALKSVISNCTHGQIDPEELSIPDLCFIFINIRAKSVGETSSPLLTCKKCGESNTVDIDLTKIKLKTHKGHTNKIELSSDRGMIMRYPTIEMATSAIDNPELSGDESFEAIASCIETIYDGDNVYKSEDYSIEELIRFVGELTHEQFDTVLKFFSTMPELRHNVTFECKKCNEKNKLTLGGIRDFFL